MKSHSLPHFAVWDYDSSLTRMRNLSTNYNYPNDLSILLMKKKIHIGAR